MFNQKVVNLSRIPLQNLKEPDNRVLILCCETLLAALLVFLYNRLEYSILGKVHLILDQHHL